MKIKVKQVLDEMETDTEMYPNTAYSLNIQVKVTDQYQANILENLAKEYGIHYEKYSEAWNQNGKDTFTFVKEIAGETIIGCFSHPTSRFADRCKTVSHNQMVKSLNNYYQSQVNKTIVSSKEVNLLNESLPSKEVNLLNQILPEVDIKPFTYTLNEEI